MHTFISVIFLVTQLSVEICIQNSQSIFEEEPYFQSQMEGVQASDFELVGGLIFLEANLNGKTEKFILDTGSPHFLLNQIPATGKRTAFVLRGVGGGKKVTQERNLDFNWNGINLKRKECFAVDLKNISNAKGRDFAGLISYDQVKKHEVVIDYEKGKVFLVNKKSRKQFFKNYEKTEKIWFRMVGHLPVVSVKIGKKRFYFGIDTGAEVNVIDKRLWKRISKQMDSYDYSSSIVVGGNQEISVLATRIKEIKVGKSYYQDMPFVFADLSFLKNEDGVAIDGLLGYPFLEKAQFSIDYRKNQLNKWALKKIEKRPIELAITPKK